MTKRKTRFMLDIEALHRKPLEEVLSELFAKHHTQQAVAAELGVDASTLSGWMWRLGLTTRTIVVPFGDTVQ